MNTLKLIEIVDEADDLAHSLALVPAETLIKFAELIVQRCAELSDLAEDNDLHGSTIIKRHFGIEE